MPRVTFLPRPLAAIQVGEELDVAPFALLGTVDNVDPPEAFGVNGKGLLVLVPTHRVQVVDGTVLGLLSDARASLEQEELLVR